MKYHNRIQNIVALVCLVVLFGILMFLYKTSEPAAMSPPVSQSEVAK